MNLRDLLVGFFTVMIIISIVFIPYYLGKFLILKVYKWIYLDFSPFEIWFQGVGGILLPVCLAFLAGVIIYLSYQLSDWLIKKILERTR